KRAKKSVSTAFPSTISNPTGSCINEFAAKIHSADNNVPILTSQAEAAIAHLGSLPRPNIQTPINVDSIKNASNASTANGAPNTSPINREYSDQFIPNWNSCRIPVTTPIANDNKKTFPQNLDISK